MANDAVINVKVSTKTKQILEAMADEQDVTVSSIVRACVDQELGLQAVLNNQQLRYVKLLLSDILVHYHQLHKYNFELYLGPNPKYNAEFLSAGSVRDEAEKALKLPYQQKVGAHGFYTEPVMLRKNVEDPYDNSNVTYVPMDVITQAKQDDIIQEAYPFIASHIPTYFPPNVPPKNDFSILPFDLDIILDDNITLDDIFENDILRGDEL